MKLIKKYILNLFIVKPVTEDTPYNKYERYIPKTSDFILPRGHKYF
jgi:hypothetical protein